MSLEEADKAAVEKQFGAGVLKGDTFQAHFGFRYDGDRRIWEIEVDQAKVLENLVSKHSLDAPERNVLHGVSDGPAADKALSGLAERTPKQEALLQEIKKSRDSSFTNGVLDVLSARQPKFFFTSHFERMSGMVQAVADARRGHAGVLPPSEHAAPRSGNRAERVFRVDFGPCAHGRSDHRRRSDCA
ncbi:MAG: hypothetical protein Q7J25_08515 [Vicinamibacterales bacterium]|nr:hypothetical protein [Vicinamibacterales bacterium]